MKNDNMVKGWLSEIRADFKKEKASKSGGLDNGTGNQKAVLSADNENSLKTSRNISADENVTKSAVDAELSENSVESDVHGFTVEEMIEIVKKAQSAQTLGDAVKQSADDGAPESSSSDSESEDTSDDESSSSDSDNDSKGERRKVNGNKVII